MQIEQLQEVLFIADRRAIVKKLKALGYGDCARDRKYRDFLLPVIFNSDEQSTDWTENAKGDRHFKAYIFTNVTGAERATFIVLETNSIDKDNDISRSLAMDILFKE